MRKKRGVNFSIIIIVLLAIIGSVNAITTSPSQIMINSEIADKTTTADIFLELEENENARDITFTIPKEYKNNIKITPAHVSLRLKSKINIEIKDLMKLDPGEHNIEIKINDNGKPLTTGINDIIFVKAIVPEKKKTDNTNKEQKINPIIPIIIAGIISIIIIITTVLLSKKLNEINIAKENYFAKDLETKNLEQEEKINNLISETTKILNSLK